MPTINMKTSAHKVKGQGVGSCCVEQIELINNNLYPKYDVLINKYKKTDIYHFHTIDFKFFLERLLTKNTSSSIGYVHFLPETLEGSIALPPILKAIFYKYVLTFYNSMDYLVAVNPNTVEHLKKHKINNPEIIYIPNFVSESSFFPQTDRWILDKKCDMDIYPDKLVVLGVGQLQTRKGIFDFIETARHLPHIQFIWVGAFSFGKISDGYDKIKVAIENKPPNIIFPGIIDRENMMDYYNIADIMFLPSFDELFPMSILESMACRTPILLRDISVYENILFDSYMKGKTVEDFVCRITEFEKNITIRATYKEKTWQCHNLYSKESIVGQWDALYAKANAKSKGLNLAHGV